MAWTTITYPEIDMVRTGEQLRYLMDANGCDVKELQEILQLSCPQPIYRWLKGQILPSVNHLLVLSRMFNVHIEDLLVEKKSAAAAVGDGPGYMRLRVYYHRIMKMIRSRKSIRESMDERNFA